jgi:alpha-tubulin suppressor-like RCC1 family protein
LNRFSPTQIGSLSSWNQIYAGGALCFAIKTDGTVWTWGANAYGQLGISNTTSTPSPVQLGSNTNWIQLEPNWSTSYGVRNDGTLWRWGYDNTRIYNTVLELSWGNDWQQICETSGGDAIALLKTNGTLWTVGENYSGQLGNGDFDIYHYSPVQIGSQTNWTNLKCLADAFLALKNDGTLWSWGRWLLWAIRK